MLVEPGSFSTAQWIDGSDLIEEPVHLQWKYIYLYPNSGSDFVIDRQRTQSGGLSQREGFSSSLGLFHLWSNLEYYQDVVPFISYTLHACKKSKRILRMELDSSNCVPFH